MSEIKYVQKVQLSDGNIYYFYDREGIHYVRDANGHLLDEVEINGKLTTGKLVILVSEYIEDDQEIDNVLTRDSNGDIKMRDTDLLLKDIGGCSYSITDGKLKLKIGK